jgi:hypothetical protein
VEKPPADSPVVMRPFATDDVDGDGEEVKKMRVDAPGMLAERFSAPLKELGPYTSVSPLAAGAAPPPGAMVVEGKFTEMDPGSRAARFFVGFGAGKSGVTVEGTVVADAKRLATFEQRRIGVAGVAGGNSLDKLVSDTRDIGDDIAKFLSAWAKGEKLD